MGMGILKGSGPYAAMVVIQFLYAASTILCKIAIDRGMSFFVFVVYRHAVAAVILGPLAYVFEFNSEKKQRHSLTVMIFVKIFLLALVGMTGQQLLFYAGLHYTSVTVSSALSNLVPGLTFLMAVLLRMEKVNVGSLPSLAKVFGTSICIGGAMIFTFWKGFLFKGFTTKPFISPHHNISGIESKHGEYDWIKGSALIATSQVAYSSWLTLQAIVREACPGPLSMFTLLCFSTVLQSSVVALVFEKTTSWRLGWNVELLAIIYTGIVISVGVYYLQSWCISKKGPVFSSAFFPLLLVIVGIFSAFLFAERLHLGSVVGAVLIVIGLYCVLWGKSKDTHFVKKEGRNEVGDNLHTIKA